MSVLPITSFEQVGVRKNKSLTLALFGEFNSVESVAGRNLVIFFSTFATHSFSFKEIVRGSVTITPVSVFSSFIDF